MATLKLGSTTAITESGGTVSLDSAVANIPAAGVTGVLPVGVTGGAGLIRQGTVQTFYAQSNSSSITVSSPTWATYMNTVSVTSPTAGNILYILIGGGGYMSDNTDNYLRCAILVDDSINTQLNIAHTMVSYSDEGSSTYWGAGSFPIGKYVVPSGSGTIIVRSCPYVSGSTPWSMDDGHIFVQEIQPN